MPEARQSLNLKMIFKLPSNEEKKWAMFGVLKFFWEESNSSELILEVGSTHLEILSRWILPRKTWKELKDTKHF